ncbi:uncharacterized protein LOC131298566 [Rhododendron vialii]|uniref:uncharacterized protein LOC131298566 n=1 Tax=Rhododendron vialii TaxID=182163 RepID=UPI00265D6D5C|nr:uncharacterized protein LOC131298566 [Rhododendron vialii]
MVVEIWFNLKNLENSSSHLGYSIRESFRVQVNSGNATAFWEHVWLGELPLKEEYPRLFSLSSQKEELICNMRGDAAGGSWDLLFRRGLIGREKGEMVNLRLRLQQVTLIQSKPDELLWRWTGDGKFTVKSAYGPWELLSYSSNTFLGSIWKNLSPPKVEIFAWLAVKEKATTGVVEYEMGVPGLRSEFSKLVVANGFSNLEKHIWEACFYATFWSLWLVRNDYIFNNSAKQAWEVGDVVKTMVAMWMKVKFDIKVYTVEEFKVFLDGIRKLKL